MHACHMLETDDDLSESSSAGAETEVWRSQAAKLEESLLQISSSASAPKAPRQGTLPYMPAWMQSPAADIVQLVCLAAAILVELLL